MTISRCLILFCVAAALTCAQPNKSAEADLGAARHLEEAEGNYPAAIKAYQNILKKYGKDRALSATALVRMGECYEKLGDAEARTTYERTIRDFADQRDAVSTARARLAVLDGNKRETGVATQQIANKLGARQYGAAISRDGRYVAFTNTNMVGIHDLVSGEVRTLVSKHSSVDWFQNPIISPDGKQVAYTWYESPQGTVQVQLVGSDGSNPRVLGGPGVVGAVSWSSDGKYLVAYLDPESRNCKMILLSTADGSQKEIGPADRFTMAGLGGAFLSPDGRYLALAKFGPRTARDQNLYIRPVDGGSDTVLAENVVTGLTTGAWAPDGSRLLFTNEKSGSSDLYSLRVQDGRSLGRPVLVQKGVGRLLGVDTGGNYYYQIRNNTRDVYVAGVDPQTGKLTQSPKVEATPWGDALWSPDGQSMAYLVHPGGVWTAVVRTAATGEERKFSLSGLVMALQWFPDGKSLFWQRGNGVLFQLDAKTGDSRPLLDSAVIEPYRDNQGNVQGTVALSPDGRTIYYLVRDESSHLTRILRRDLGNARPLELSRVSADVIGGLSVSPDGGRLAFLTRLLAAPGGTGSKATWALLTLGTSGGEPKQIASRADLSSPVWSADGRRLFYIKASQPNDVLSIPSEGGEPQPLGIALHSLSALSIHPKGDQIVFTDAQSDNQLWVLKNLK